MSGVDIYWSFRSPYSYLATARLRAMSDHYSVPFTIKPVYPIAVRIPGFFKTVNPLWPPYLIKDCFRISQYLGVPFGPPKPDPIVMDFATGEVDSNQPYIHRLTRIGVLASKTDKSMAFFDEVSKLIWSGEVEWPEGDHLANAVARAGLDLAELDAQAEAEVDTIEAEITQNEADQKAAGHWGVPLMVYNEEPFFGQDRLDLLAWRLDQAGLGK